MATTRNLGFPFDIGGVVPHRRRIATRHAVEEWTTPLRPVSSTLRLCANAQSKNQQDLLHRFRPFVCLSSFFEGRILTDKNKKGRLISESPPHLSNYGCRLVNCYH